MDIEWILFDIDNTLLDFDNSSHRALQSSFRQFELPFNDDNYKIYKEINADIWKRFETGQITATTLRHERFDLLFNALGIRPTTGQEFNAYYLKQLIVQSTYFENVPKMLAKLKTKYKISVITNGLKEVQRPRLKQLNISHYFDSIIVSDEIGHAKPERAYFDYVFQTLEKVPNRSKTLVVGDNIHSDIKGGIDYGCLTCWVKHEKANEIDLNPTFTIKNIQEFNKVIDYNNL